jgi:hypothetical protein
MSDDVLARADAWLGADERHCWEGGLIRDLAAALREARAEVEVLGATSKRNAHAHMRAERERDEAYALHERACDLAEGLRRERDEARAVLEKIADNCVADECLRCEDNVGTARAFLAGQGVK